jgi:hypothetical protein
VLVWHRGVTDADTGGEYTVKVYESEKLETENKRQHTRITLKPLNPKYGRIELTPSAEGDVRVLADFRGSGRCGVRGRVGRYTAPYGRSALL